MIKLKYFPTFIFLLLALASCETKDGLTKMKKVPVEKRNSLRINLNDNFLIQNPASIGSRSEKFIKYLMYEGLYKVNKDGKTVPTLINQHKIDSFRNIHTFDLNPKIAFHNGDLLTTDHIYARFKRIIDEESNNDIIKSFRKNIVGYKKFKHNKKFKTGKDSIPSGLKIINKYSFSLEFIKTQQNLAITLANPAFWIYHSNDGINFYGTGNYKIDYANEDISYNLIKHKRFQGEVSVGIEVINIRFIKNKTAEVSEFLNGSLDLIVNTKELDNHFQETKYEKFKSTETSYTALKVLKLYNSSNKNVTDLLLSLIQGDYQNRVYNVNNGSLRVLYFQQENASKSMINLTISPDTIDSANKIDIPIYLNCYSDCSKNLDKLRQAVSKYFTLNELNYEDLNPNAPYLVIEESKMNVYSENIDINNAKKLLSSSDLTSNKPLSFIVVESIRDNIYSNISLRGLNEYSNWEVGIQDMYFVKPRILN